MVICMFVAKGKNTTLVLSTFRVIISSEDKTNHDFGGIVIIFTHGEVGGINTNLQG